MSAEFVADHKAKEDSEGSKTHPIPGLVIRETKKEKKNENKGVTSITEDILPIHQYWKNRLGINHKEVIKNQILLMISPKCPM